MFITFDFSNRPKNYPKKIARSLVHDISSLPEKSRGVVLILANCMLRLVADTYDRNLSKNPQQAKESDINAALTALYGRHRAIEDIERYRQRGMISNTPRLAAHDVFDLLSTELVMLTIGTGKFSELRNVCGAAWMAAWKGRNHLRSAVVWLRRYEAETSVPSLPDPAGRAPYSDIELLRVGFSVPSFLRRH